MEEHIKKLINDAKEGDEEAWKEILKLYQRRLLSYIWDLGRNSSYSGNIHIDPFEIYGETLKRAYQGLPHFDIGRYDDFCKWLCGIARRVFIDGLRKAENEPNLVDIDVFRKKDISASYNQNIADDIESRELWEILQPALESLSKKDKEIIHLRYYHGLSYAAIAKRKGMSEGAVRVRCLRARQHLRRKLKGNKAIDEYLEDGRDQK